MEDQNVSETLDGKTLEEVSVLSCLSETYAGSDLVTEIQLSECYGGGSVAVDKKLVSGGESVAVDEKLVSGGENVAVDETLANGDDKFELEGVGFEQKLVDGHGDVELEGVESDEKLANVDGNNDLEGVVTEQKLMDGPGGVVMEQKLVDGPGGVESEMKLANVDGNNDLEGIDAEEKLVDGQGGVENETLVNVDDCNGLMGVDIENEFGNVDDGIDLEALGLENDTVGIENLMEGGTFEHETQPQGSIIPDTNKKNDDDVLVSELGAEFNESQVNTVDAVETIDTSNAHDNDSPRKIEVSGDGISLFVEVFGPLNGIYQDGEMLGDGGSDCMLSMKNDSPMDVNGNEAEGDAGDNQDHNFAVGDLVWVKIKTPLWWPGIICDPSASKDAGKYDERGFFFVKYFGNTNSSWCQPFQLKPFLEYFEQMSCQNKSRSFYGAIEKALGEIGRRVKQKMTCSCFSNQVAAQSFPSEDGKDEPSVFVASQFDPAGFLEFIRLRALDLRRPGSIEFTVNESCLSAFYCSIGHKHVPLYKLRPTNNAKDEDSEKLSSGDSVLKSCKSDSDYCKTTEVKMSGSLESPKGSMISSSEVVNGSAGGKSEKSFESRERKKSKYLSYPYVNSWGRKNSLGQGENETENHEDVTPGGVKSPSSPATVSTPIGNCSNTNSLRKSRKSVTVNGICHTPEIITASSAEMLQELRLTALDCFFPSQSTSSIPIQEFYLSYRTFRNPEGEVQMDENKETALGCRETYESSLGQPPTSVLPKKRGRKKREAVNPTGQIVDTVVLGPDALEKGTVNRKKREVATAAVVHHEIGVLGDLPDLNGNNAGLSVENMQVIGPAPTQGKLVPKRRKMKNDELVSDISTADVSNGNTEFIPLLKCVQVTSPSHPNTECIGGQPNAYESHAVCSSLPLNSQIMGPLSSAKAEGRKRKRKEKASNVQNDSSGLPDLNGSTELNSVTGQGKPKRRRRRTTKSAIGISAPNNIGNTGIAAANTLLLDFRSGSSVPSKEYIAATFSRFGALVESKMQFLNDSTAQVVFVKDSDAIEALQSLQSRNPFGPSLASYRIQHVSTSSNVQASHSFQPADVLSGAVPSNGEGPGLVVIKQNLEAMTTMLEKAGDNLSPEMRAKLESEVKGFLNKVSSMVGSPSS